MIIRSGVSGRNRTDRGTASRPDRPTDRYCPHGFPLDLAIRVSRFNTRTETFYRIDSTAAVLCSH